MDQFPQLSNESPGVNGTYKTLPFSYTSYWSRSYAIKFLRETGDLIVIGGEAPAMTTALNSLTNKIQGLGFKKVVIYEDDNPLFLGGDRNVPDMEIIYKILEANPRLIRNKMKIKRLHKQYRHNGVYSFDESNI